MFKKEISLKKLIFYISFFIFLKNIYSMDSEPTLDFDKNPLAEIIKLYDDKQPDWFEKLTRVSSFLENDSKLVNQVDEKEVPPLAIACSTGYINICKLLVNYGANLKYKDNQGRTLIHQLINIWINQLKIEDSDLSIEIRKVKFLKFYEGLSFLLANDVNINDKDNKNNTAFKNAIETAIYPEIFIALWLLGGCSCLKKEEQKILIIDQLIERKNTYVGPYSIEYYEHIFHNLNEIINFFEKPESIYEPTSPLYDFFATLIMTKKKQFIKNNKKNGNLFITKRRKNEQLYLLGFPF